MYLYETHLHTYPVSRCAKADVKRTLVYYKHIGYSGVFITNHFIDGNINIAKHIPYRDRINFCFSDYEKAVLVGKEIGISVFCGTEMSYQGTDFLVYGLNKEWYLRNPQIENMPRTQLLKYLRNNGALIIHAHPFREAPHIDHIRLYPRLVDGVEIYNANQSDLGNRMAKAYAEYYNLIRFAGSDNHTAEMQTKLAGVMTERPIFNEIDFITQVRTGMVKPYIRQLK